MSIGGNSRLPGGLMQHAPSGTMSFTSEPPDVGGGGDGMPPGQLDLSAADNSGLVALLEDI